MKKYRLSKYNPKKRSDLNIYEDMDWTSYSDIGKTFHGKIFTSEDYLEIEKKYCDSIIAIMKFLEVKNLQIKNLESIFTSKEVSCFLHDKGLYLTKDELKILDSVKENDIVSIESVKEYIRLLLRECLWCILKDVDSEIYLEFGYDYYTYIYCSTIAPEIIAHNELNGIYIE